MKLINSHTSDCRDCYKCLRECSVKAINYRNNQATISEDDCILCGNCTLVCPQNAQVAVDDYSSLINILNSGKKVIASVAPSFISDFNVESFDVFKELLISAGFTDAQETIIGARLVNKEYEKLMKYQNDLVISTCCPVVINYVTKYYPQLIKYLAPVVSPMVAHGFAIKEADPDAVVVFIGPCLAKKAEMTWEENAIDLVITFQELDRLFKGNSINLPPLPEVIPTTNEYSKIRLYPTSGGIIKSLNEKHEDVTYVNVDGLKNVKAFLDELVINDYHNTFVEASACNGSCIGGPCKINHDNYLESITRLKDYVRKRPKTDFTPPVGDFSLRREFKAEPRKLIIPSDYDIRQILRQIGKENKSQELNCGACGFNSCREKAIAVYNGKAELNMCLPFMKERSESLSALIINNSPNAIVSFDGELNLQAINPIAYEYLGIPTNLKVNQIRISDYIDLFDYELLISGAINVDTIKKKISIARVERHFDLSIVYVRDMDFIFGIYKDITTEEEKESFLQAARFKTVNVANELIDKQMRSVQEIASLLGETVAETKIALTNLKKAMEDDNDSKR